MSKYLLLAFSLLAVNQVNGDDNVLTIEGQYQNKNLYVSNAVSNSGIGFCAYEVRVNGEVTTDQVQSSAFEIDLSQLNLGQGESVVVQILHKEGCQPKVLNPLVLRPQATFEVKEIKLGEDGLLQWKTTSESGSLPYSIEVFKWNKWVKVGEVQGLGTAAENAYSFKLTLISGTNKVRVTQKGNMGKIVSSQAVETVSKVVKPTWEYKNGKVVFTAPTDYEIYDKFGQARIRGFGTEINLSSIQKDNYFLCFDSEVVEFKVK
jgi:hypothetical protein